jgi:hypothetical protein
MIAKVPYIRAVRVINTQKCMYDNSMIRTCAGEPIAFRVLRLNHSAMLPLGRALYCETLKFAYMK